MVFESIKFIINGILPSSLNKNKTKIIENILIKLQPFRHRYVLKKMRDKLINKNKIKVVFIAQFSSIWKCENLYKLMFEGEIFEPVVVVCPIANFAYMDMLIEMDRTHDFFKERGYEVYKAYDPITQEYSDLIKDFNVDIVFYTSPYGFIIDKRYHIKNFKNILTCYIPYSFFSTKNFIDVADSLFFNLLWKVYSETKFHKDEIKDVQRIRGRNIRVKGYPGCDFVHNKVDVIKWKNPVKKKIIWGPHWLPLEIFLRDSEYMLFLAKKYEDSIQVAFKPHPLLKKNLEKNEVWGVEKTRAYYKKWEQGENTILVEGYYGNLFLDSDALIHNSGSFLSEYISLKKPSLFVQYDENYMIINSKYDKKIISWNSYGKHAISKHYLALNQADIEYFVKNVVLLNFDLMREERELFVNEVIFNHSEKSPSFLIYNDLIASINGTEYKVG